MHDQQMEKKVNDNSHFRNGFKHARYAAIKEHLYSDLNGEAVVLSVKSGKYYGLKGAGGVIWRVIETPKTIDEIQISVMNEYEIGEDECLHEIETFLTKLIDEGLIEVLDERSD